MTRPVDVGGLTVGDSHTVAVLNPAEQDLTPDLSPLAKVDVPWYDAVRAYRRLAGTSGDQPLNLQLEVEGDDLEVLLRTSTVFGSLLCDGIGDSVGLQAAQSEEDRSRLLFNVLQAAGVRSAKTEWGGCGGGGGGGGEWEGGGEGVGGRRREVEGVKIAI